MTSRWPVCLRRWPDDPRTVDAGENARRSSPRAGRSWRRLLLLSWLLLPLPRLAATTDAADYHIDAAASDAMFRVRLFWVGNVNGRFTRVDGDVASGPRPDSWVVDATIQVDSVTMSSSHLRQWVLAPSFFDAAHHPTIQFVSDPFGQAELDSGGTLTGQLTLRGITAPVHFMVEPAHCTQPSEPCRLALHGNLHRSTFGMTSDRLALSDNVDFNLNITLQPRGR